MRGRQLPDDAPEAMRKSWDGLSAWDTPEAAVAASRDMLSAHCIVWYDIPRDCGATYEPSGPPGHFDIRGDLDELKQYLSPHMVDLERRQ